MVLIIGGAYQGKLDYAKRIYKIADTDIFDCKKKCGLDISKKLIYNFQEYILELVTSDMNPGGVLQGLDLDNKIIICDDISSGVVPVDERLRRWREETGRAISRLSARSERVIRIFCGIETVLK